VIGAGVTAVLEATVTAGLVAATAPIRRRRRRRRCLQRCRVFDDERRICDRHRRGRRFGRRRFAAELHHGADGDMLLTLRHLASGWATTRRSVDADRCIAAHSRIAVGLLLAHHINVHRTERGMSIQLTLDTTRFNRSI
jgi:hypothetical protein